MFGSRGLGHLVTIRRTLNCFMQMSYVSIHTGNLMCGVWDNAQSADDSEILELAESLPLIIQSAVAPSTLEKYSEG